MAITAKDFSDRLSARVEKALTVTPTDEGGVSIASDMEGATVGIETDDDGNTVLSEVDADGNATGETLTIVMPSGDEG